MACMKRLGVAVALAAAVSVGAQTPVARVAIHVQERAGIRRAAYPVNARVPFPKAALSDASRVRLLANNVEVPAQVAVESAWPDGSVHWLAVDFNASIGPNDETAFQLEYGNGVKAEATARGLTVTESADAIQVGSVRFSKTLATLVESVKYRQEDIGPGPNGFAILDAAGAFHDATSVESLKVEILKPGPLYVVIKYSGLVGIGGDDHAPFTLTVEMPNSKSWVKVTTTVDDPGKRVRALSLHSPLGMGLRPRTWDFGTGSWSYGLLRNSTDSVTLTQVVNPPKPSSWEIRSGPKGQEQVAERAAGRRPNVAEGWGHVQGEKEAVAFAIDEFGRHSGTYTVAIDGEGQTSFRFAPAVPSTRHVLTVYEHFVAMPIAVGAVTSPVSMLYPLVAFCDPAQYVKSGVASPRDHRALQTGSVRP